MLPMESRKNSEWAEGGSAATNAGTEALAKSLALVWTSKRDHSPATLAPMWRCATEGREGRGKGGWTGV